MIIVDQLNKSSLNGTSILNNIKILCNIFGREIEYIELSDNSILIYLI
jgi:hypothetical protein